MVFYLVTAANVVNKSQPGVRIGGGLHALIHISGVVHIPGLAYGIGVSMYKVRPGVTPLGPVRNHLRSVPFETRFLAALYKQARHHRSERVSNGVSNLSF